MRRGIVGADASGPERAFQRRWRQCSAFVLITLVWVSVSASVPDDNNVASAYYIHGCKYDGSSPSIGYGFNSVTSAFQTAVNTAAGNWNADPVPGSFFIDTGSDPEINVYDAYYAWSEWAITSWGCDGDGTYSSNEVTAKINLTTMTGLSATQRAIVLTHELGHAYGIGHVTLGCSSPGPAGMRQGSSKFSCAGTPPWRDDEDGVSSVY